VADSRVALNAKLSMARLTALSNTFVLCRYELEIDRFIFKMIQTQCFKPILEGNMFGVGTGWVVFLRHH